MAKPFEENSLRRLFLGATFGAFLDSGGDIFSEICKSNIVNELGNPGLVEGTIAVQAWRRSNHMIHCTIIPLPMLAPSKYSSESTERLDMVLQGMYNIA